MTDLGRLDDWRGLRAAVAGFGSSGFAAADSLVHLGAEVVVLTEASDDRSELLGILGAEIRSAAPTDWRLPEPIDLMVVSAECPPGLPLVDQATDRQVPVWSEVELAWRLRDPGTPAPWLLVAGTREVLPTVQLTEAMVRAAGLRGVAVGEGARAVTEAVLDPAGYDVLVLGVGPTQLHHTHSVGAESAVCLDVPDADVAADLGRAYQRVRTACIYLLGDPATETLVREAEVVAGARAIGISLATPRVGMLGVVEDLLVDRAFVAERATSAAELGTLADLPGPQAIEIALVAAALARSIGVPPIAVRDALRAAR